MARADHDEAGLRRCFWALDADGMNSWSETGTYFARAAVARRQSPTARGFGGSNRYDPRSMRGSSASHSDTREPAPFVAPAGPARAAVALTVAAATFALYATTFDARSDGVVLGNDVLDYADQMLSAPGGLVWNAHHLLVHVLDALVQRALLGCGAEPGFATAWRAEQLVAAAGGAACAALVAGFVAQIAGLVRGALLGAICAVAAGNWLYAASGETYLPAIAACTGLVVCSLRICLGLSDEGWHRPALWLGLACLLRQDSVLVVPALFVLLRPAHALRATLAAGGVTLGLYAGAWAWAGGESAFLSWLRGLAETGQWGRTPGLTQFGQAAGLSLAALAWITWTSLPLGLIALGMLLLPLVPPRQLRGGFGRALLGLGAWIALRYLFFAWWQPGNLEYHTGNVAPFLLLVGLCLRPPPALTLARTLTSGWQHLRAPLLLTVAVVLLARSNGILLLWPNRAADIAPRLELAAALARPAPTAPTRGLVLALDPLTGKALLRAPREGVDIADASLAAGFGSAIGSPERSALLERTRTVLASGGGVVAVVDRVLPERMGWADAQLDPEFLAALESLGEPQHLKDTEGRVWALVLRSAPGD